MSTHPDPATFARAIVLEAADIPAGMTIAEWRQRKLAERRRVTRSARSGRRWRRRRAR